MKKLEAIIRPEKNQNLRSIMDSIGQLQSRKPGVIGENKAQHSAVALPVLYFNGTPYLLFELRSQNMRQQPGDVCFPGGKMEASDANTIESAVRELREETGVSKNNVSYIAPLDRLMTPYGIVIHPHVFMIDKPNFSPNEEVEELFTIPIDNLSQQQPDTFMMELKPDLPNDFPYSKIAGGKHYRFPKGQIPQYFYQYQGRHIWGMTSRILHHFLELITENHAHFHGTTTIPKSLI